MKERKVWEIFDIEGLYIANAETAVKAYKRAFGLAHGKIKLVVLLDSSLSWPCDRYLLICVSGYHPQNISPSTWGVTAGTAVPSWMKAKQKIESFTWGFPVSEAERDSVFWQLLSDMISLKELHILGLAGSTFLGTCTGKSLPKTLRKLRIQTAFGNQLLMHPNWQLRCSIDELEIHQTSGVCIRANSLALLAETLRSLKIIDSTLILKVHSFKADEDLSGLVDWDAEMPLSVLTNLRSLTLEKCSIHTVIDLPLSLRDFTVKDTWHMGKFADKDCAIGKNWGPLRKGTHSWNRVELGDGMGPGDWEEVVADLRG